MSRNHKHKLSTAAVDIDDATLEPPKDYVFNHSAQPRSFERSEEVLQQLKRAFPEMTLAELMEMMDAPTASVPPED